MTVRSVPGTDLRALHCDAPGCGATCVPTVTYRAAVQAGESRGWSVTVVATDPTIIDVCPVHRSLAGAR